MKTWPLAIISKAGSANRTKIVMCLLREGHLSAGQDRQEGLSPASKEYGRSTKSYLKHFPDAARNLLRIYP